MNDPREARTAALTVAAVAGALALLGVALVTDSAWAFVGALVLATPLAIVAAFRWIERL